ncbi:hypothetical protein GT347_20115 [Xylophilus rhododendri]|uniref:Uncharacterized protein n=1 Tax=Xylophilus rhododendri TaxID=2697032 RepID=A0A857J7R4_9BURK|nr:hypothetical protein [Xylophilus rhododendri]QHJ00081.1 hypothetical protein GT347_20115 [Xylophilus rhododendri]
MLEIIPGRFATYFPYARQRATGRDDAPWQGCVDIVSEYGRTTFVCQNLHASAGDAQVDASVEALAMAARDR